MSENVWDPGDQDGDGVFWDPELGVDNSPTAEAARAKAKAKAYSQSGKGKKDAQKHQDETKKAATKTSKTTAATTAAAASSSNMTTYAIGGLGVLAVLYLLTRK